MSSDTQNATMDPNMVGTAPSSTPHGIEASNIETQSAQNVGTGAAQPQETIGGPTIVGDLSLDQMWWRKREWIFLREQFEKWLANGEWHDWLWKLKVDPCGREYCLPITVQEVISKLPTYVSEDPSYEEGRAWHLLGVIIEKFRDHSQAKLKKIEASLEKKLGVSWEQVDLKAMKAQILAALADQGPEAQAASSERRQLLETLLKSIDDYVKTVGVPEVAPQASGQGN